jgi:membrane protein DedA with SNARE-associated domain
MQPHARVLAHGAGACSNRAFARGGFAGWRAGVIERFLDWLATLPTPLTYAVLAALSALENVFPPVPADVAVALGAFLAQRGEVSAPILGLVCWLANCTSAAAVYFLARRRGEAFFTDGLGRKLLPPTAFAAVREAYHRHGIAGVFVSRFLPGVRAAVLPFAGVAGLPPGRALLPAMAASGLWYTALIVAGSSLGLGWDAVRDLVEDANRVLGLIGLLALLACGVWLVRRSRRERSAD